MKLAALKNPNSYTLPAIIAFGLHLVLLVVMSTQWIAQSEAPRIKPIKAISATVIQTENKQVKKRQRDKIKRKKNADKKQADKKRADKKRKDAKKKEKAKRKADAKKAADKKKADAKQKSDLKRKADAKKAANKKREIAAEKQRQAMLAEEARQQADEASLEDALKEEQEALIEEQASSDQSELMRYMNAIREQIQRSWTVPPSARRKDKLRLRMQLLPSGEVAVVTIAKASGNAALDRSAEQAVYRAQPFMVPKSNRLFEQMRVVNIDMSPENLRW